MDRYGWDATGCGYWLEVASTSLRHGRIQQVLSVACPCHLVVSRLRGNDGAEVLRTTVTGLTCMDVYG